MWCGDTSVPFLHSDHLVYGCGFFLKSETGVSLRHTRVFSGVWGKGDNTSCLNTVVSFNIFNPISETGMANYERKRIGSSSLG